MVVVVVAAAKETVLRALYHMIFYPFSSFLTLLLLFHSFAQPTDFIQYFLLFVYCSDFRVFYFCCCFFLSFVKTKALKIIHNDIAKSFEIKKNPALFVFTTVTFTKAKCAKPTSNVSILSINNSSLVLNFIHN